MDVVKQGAVAVLRFEAVDDTGTLVSPTAPVVTLFNPADVASGGPHVPTVERLGLFRYDFAVPAGAVLGVWRAHFTATGGYVADTFFEVAAATTSTPSVDVPWIGLLDAQILTGVDALTDLNLTQAAQEIYRVMRWVPVWGVDLAGVGMREMMQREALGAAIAWQAAHNLSNPSSEEMGGTPKSESILGYSITYGSTYTTSGLGGVAHRILAGSGLLRRSGFTSAGNSRSAEYIEVE